MLCFLRAREIALRTVKQLHQLQTFAMPQESSNNRIHDCHSQIYNHPTASGTFIATGLRMTSRVSNDEPRIFLGVSHYSTISWKELLIFSSYAHILLSSVCIYVFSSNMFMQAVINHAQR
jgi:hypothetical protein